MHDSSSWLAIWGWGFVLYFGLILLMFSNIGNWVYTYQAHKRHLDHSQNRSAFDLLDENFAKGKLTYDDYISMREELVQAGNTQGGSNDYHDSKGNLSMSMLS